MLVISADLPWPYAPRRNPAKFGQGAAGRYRLMSAEELIGLGSLVRPMVEWAGDVALFMWAVWPNLPLALQVIEAWGFRYTTAAFVWAKTTSGGGFHRRCGFYTASNTEPVLLSVEGKMLPKRKLVPQVIAVPPGKHSAKPEEMQDRIELMYPKAKKIELFARRVRPGWICLGNEITGLDIREDLRRLLGRGTG
jgi:N6-adenosine-specific RNA methylase IME4